MRAVVLDAPNKVSLQDVPGPGELRPGEARVRVLRVGVCGTDLHAYTGDQPMIAYPVIPGHELAVEVTVVGDGVDQPTVGSLCAVVPYVNCGNCEACSTGRTNACLHLKVLGVHVDGGMTEELNVPARLLVPAPGLHTDAVALVEMLAIGEHAVVRAGIGTEDRVTVVGAGPIGMGAAVAARRRTARVALVDVSEDRLRFAEERGLAIPVPSGAHLAERLAEAISGAPTVVIDATGSARAMAASAGLLGPGGRLVLVGHTGGQLTFDNQTLHRRELTVLASRNATKDDFESVMTDLGSGRTDVADWVTHRSSLKEVPREMATWAARPPGLVKALVQVA